MNMEIYNSRPVSQRFSIPEGYASPVVDVIRNGKRLTQPSLTQEANAVVVKIPYAATTIDGPLNINITFSIDGMTYTKSFVVTVSTPYADIEEIRDALGADEMNFSDSQLSQAERRIRNIVNKYTQQEFGKSGEALQILGTGETTLRLPKRLLSIDTLAGANVYPSPDYYAVRGDGWYLGLNTTPPTGELAYANPIRDPGSQLRLGFLENYVYTIDGTWGYESVPTDVKEATLILIEDALCPDSEYRDRYVDNYKAADFRVEYSDRAFRGTGSVMADQLLEPYRRWSMTVV